ncbi:LysR family transcriptional regulator [Nonomuraea sediminis]|uniref:LysR family transcriptional regulator n=1 Tax=Nonomuraea sediminis TaxID=2835864 RepID=UPI001BDD5DDB|nr:LysR family transcriptional regulator [Nonomuraea sediminis]
MELRQLAYFVAVAEEQHFTRAAQRVKVAQPAVSQQIIRLERELGEQLLIRTPRGVQLTGAGRAFLPHARATLAAAQSGRDALASMRGLLAGRLSVGTLVPAPQELPSLLGRYRRDHPGVELRLRDGHTTSLISEVDEGTLDVAVIGLGARQPVPDKVDSQVIRTEPAVIVVSRDHPLAASHSVPFAQLRDEPMVTLPPESGQRMALDAAARTAGFTPRIAAESSDLGILVDLAAEGVGIALVPRSAAPTSERLAIIQLSRPKLTRRLILIWQKDGLSPAARAFLPYARTTLADPDDSVEV